MKTYKFYFLLLAMLMAMPLTVSAGVLDGVGIPPEHYIKIDIDSLKNVAEEGSVEAQKILGRIYSSNDDFLAKPDTKEALKWYRKAAEQGDVDAQKVLGDFYISGGFWPDFDEANQNYAEAAKWYRKMAEQGSAWAQERVGDLYRDGEGVKQDYTEAAKWYCKAVEQGYGPAQNRLGELYAKGKGVKKDYDEAIKLYLTVDDDIRDYDILGDLYAAKHDYTEAAKWYRKAVDSDKENNYISKGSLKLGLCYAFGKGVKHDFSEATKLIKGYIKGLKEDFTKENGKVPAYIFGALILLLFIFLFFGSFSVKKKQFGLAKSIIIAFAFTVLSFLCLYFTYILGFIFIFGQPLIASDFLMFFVFLLLFVLFFGLFIASAIFATKKKTINANSLSQESENETSKDTLLDGKNGHKVKFNTGTYNNISLLVFLLAFLVGIPYYWFVTKTLGHEPLSPLSSSLGFQEDPPQFIISLSIFGIALIIGLISIFLLSRLVWGWRNTHMDWKKGVIHCIKPLKKNQYAKGLITPFLVLGLLPLLVSPFVNSFVMCLFGIFFMGITSTGLMCLWELRKEPRDCMIQDIKGEIAVFVLDEEQPADNE